MQGQSQGKSRGQSLGAADLCSSELDRRGTPLQAIVCLALLAVIGAVASPAKSDALDAGEGNKARHRRHPELVQAAVGRVQNQQRKRRIPVRLVWPGEAKRPDAAPQVAPPSPTVDDPETAIRVANINEPTSATSVGTDARGSAVGNATSGVDGGDAGARLGESVVNRRALGQAPSGKRMVASRTSSAPLLDGRVDEAVWQMADPVTDFLQREPREGGQPSEPTEARILYDDRNLYLGFVLHDSSPGAIRATQLRRDSLAITRRNSGDTSGSGGAGGGGGTDDTISVLLDSYHDHRNAFVFTVNPLGTRSDATIQNENVINSDWDESWEAAAQITERGWEAELAIPWAILRYAAGAPLWGVDFRRQIRRNNEEVLWSNYRQDYNFVTVSQAGHLVGLDDLGLTERFRIKPYVAGTYNSFEQRLQPLTEQTAEFGIEDFKIKVTSNLTSQLTFNTDFAQVEVDEQRFNLTRFSLFFPEKREFFLEAASNFNFGTVQNRWEGFDAPLSELFFSRRIGLAPDGTPLPIDFGAKLTGKIGRGGNLGLINVGTGESLFGRGRNFTALRWRQDVLSRSSIGALVTNVQAAGGETNRVFGVDANFTFFDHLNISGFAAQSRDHEIDGGHWIGQLQAGWSSDLWLAKAEVMVVDEDFRTDLGFILRSDITKQSYTLGWKPRPQWSWMRQVNVRAYFDHFADLSGRTVNWAGGLDARLNFESGDGVFLNYNRFFDRLEFPFRIHPRVTIPIGDYDYQDWWLSFNSYRGRRISGSTLVRFGSFFGGRILVINPSVNFRVSEKLNLRPAYNYNRVTLPVGFFTAHVARLRADVSFSDRWLTDMLAQYNSVTDQLSLFARLRHIYRTGDDFYLVYRQTRLFDGIFSGLDDRSLTAKMTYSFRW